MNNEAFQKLVREHANDVKSTKEIAREAVQAEFQRKRKRGQRRGGDNHNYSSDEDAPSHHRRRQRDNARRDEGGSAAHGWKEEEEKEDTDDCLTYRDRAKERREGKVVTGKKSPNDLLDDDGDALLWGRRGLHDDDDIEDEEIYSTSKGLDRRLVKRTADQESKEEEDALSSFPQNKLQAIELLSSSSFSPQSPLGKEMLTTYLKILAAHREEAGLAENVVSQTVATSAGRVVQRSTLTFSLRGHPQDAERSWEIPQEQTFADATSSCTKASPLDALLLSRIERSLQRLSSKAKSSNVGSDSKVLRDESDDEDDIFGNVGEYMPTDREAKKNTIEKEPPSSVGKGAIFNNLATNPAHSDSSARIKSTDAKEEPQSTRLTGLSAIEGYDEHEIDADFEGRFEDDEDKKKKKKEKEAGGGVKARQECEE